MRVLITQVEPKVIKKDPSFITSFRVYGLLKSGKEIRMFANRMFDLRNYVNQELNLLINCKLTSISEDIRDDPYLPFFEGEYSGEFDIPDKWKIDLAFEPKNGDDPYHSIQIEDGILIISSYNLNRYYSIKQGETFKFKAGGFDLMAWEQAEGEKEIDPSTYEKKFLEKFWKLMHTTREKSNQNSEVQKELIYQELLNWSYDELSLFGDITLRLEYKLQLLNLDFINVFKNYFQEGLSFAAGLILLGKNAIKDAFLNSSKLLYDIEVGVYSEPLDKIKSDLHDMLHTIIEEKSGLTLDKVESGYVRKDIDEVRDRIYNLIDNELNITN